MGWFRHCRGLGRGAINTVNPDLASCDCVPGISCHSIAEANHLLRVARPVDRSSTHQLVVQTFLVFLLVDHDAHQNRLERFSLRAARPLTCWASIHFLIASTASNTSSSRIMDSNTLACVFAPVATGKVATLSAAADPFDRCRLNAIRSDANIKRLQRISRRTKQTFVTTVSRSCMDIIITMLDPSSTSWYISG